MALKIPPSLKLGHLKSLAFQCGISTSGTKALLTNRLINEVTLSIPSHGNKTASPIRVLSIDMGIRNLAYCVLDLPQSSKLSIGSSIPSITAWRRIAVSSARVPTEDDKSSSIPPPKEVFDPQTLSNAAYTLLRNTLLPHKPTHILIERQRFRSMGSPHILEWTVRVNMFESMLYAVLTTLKTEKIWQGTVLPITPGKVGPFWIEPKLLKSGSIEGATATSAARRRTKARNTKNAKLLNKGAKIDLVQSWLEAQQMVSLGTPEVQSTAKAYLEKWHRVPGRKAAAPAGKIGEAEVMGKLDDLADSLLQGMAWIQWEKNKKNVLKNGVHALDLG